MMTAYDYPSAKHVDRAGIDVLLVGDSLGMTCLGYDTTLPVTVEDMLLHCKAARRGCSRALMVGDLPFGSYEICTQQALETSYRLVKEAGVDCVKLEGGSADRVHTVQALVTGGVAVMGHIGLTPQSFCTQGGFRAQGRSERAARELIEHALQLQDAGACALVVECVPPEVGHAITEQVEIPTIGIGAGPSTSGQVLVYHDVLGMSSNNVPRFCKQYAQIGDQISNALASFHHEVKGTLFPSAEFSPYKMSPQQVRNSGELIQDLQLKPGIATNEVCGCTHALEDEEEKGIKLY